MKKFLPFAFALLLVCTLLSSAQNAARGATVQSDLEARVDELEEALALQGQKTKKTTQALEEVLVYLEAQAKAAERLGQVLDQSEELGFTWGINPESREVLLAGWRKTLKATQEGVPSLKDAKKRGEQPRPPIRRTRDQ